jgi:hypothetical protein
MFLAVFRIRIRIQLVAWRSKKSSNEEKTQIKDRQLGIKSIKINVIGILKNFIVTFFIKI